MNIKYLFFALCLCIAANAQTRDVLFGSWKYESIADDMGVTEEKKAKAQGMFESLTYVFYPDNYYENKLLNHTERGTWKFDGKGIAAMPEAPKSPYTVEVLQIDGDKMKIKMQALIVNMTRTESFSNPAALLYKWKFTGTRLDADDDDDDIRPAPANNFIDLQNNNTYSLVLGPLKETGNWWYNEKEKTLNVTANGTTKQWKIVSYTDKELVLLNAAGAQQIFKH